MTVINSDLIYSVKYEDNENLIIITKNGSKIIYHHVPKEIYEEFINSEDYDHYYTAQISQYNKTRAYRTGADEYPNDDPWSKRLI